MQIQSIIIQTQWPEKVESLRGEKNNKTQGNEVTVV